MRHACSVAQGGCFARLPWQYGVRSIFKKGLVPPVHLQYNCSTSRPPIIMCFPSHWELQLQIWLGPRSQ